MIIGLGSIGQALLPLLARHFPRAPVHIFERDVVPLHRALCARYGAGLGQQRIGADSYREILGPLLQDGGFVLNLATSVSTCALIELAQERGCLYLDTCIDPWSYEHAGAVIATSNHELREAVLALGRRSAGRATALVANGANPGFVSVLVKKGLLEMARAHLAPARAAPRDRDDWARLAQALDVRVIQISERDAQAGRGARAEGEFVNTWSVEGLVTECLQPGELGWGTHETTLPESGRAYADGCGAAIWIDRPSCTLRVRSWSPNALDFDAYLITHNEALSIADYFTLREASRVAYRPTAYYAYHPCDETVASMALLGSGSSAAIRTSRVLKDEIVAGIDELGVFLISGTYRSLWIGSELSIGKARSMAECNNATSLQVVSSVIGGMAWMIAHPRAGVVESEALDHDFVYDIVEPYWAPVVSVFVDWRPAPGKSALVFSEFLAPTA